MASKTFRGQEAARCSSLRFLALALVLACIGARAAIPTVSVSNLFFEDFDLDLIQLAGTLTWSPPGSVVDVTEYVVGVATTSWGDGLAALPASPVPVGTNEVTVPADTPVGIASYLTVFTSNAHGTQATPVSMTFVDVTASAASVLFIDKDLDAGQLGGTVTWSPPQSLTAVAGYKAYWAEDAAGVAKALIADVGVGTNSVTVAAETPLSTRSFVLVYTRSSLIEQSTPAPHTLVDRASTVTSLAFADADLDPGELAGEVSWTAPVDFSQVTFYSFYWSLGGFGVSRSLFGDYPVAMTSPPALSDDSAKGSYTYFVVYTKSALVEQTTPSGLLISDLYASVSSLTFVDQDLDSTEVGGVLSWVPDGNAGVAVLNYTVYFSTAVSGAGRSELGGVLGNTNELALPPDTALGSFTKILVYASSVASGEQTTPSSTALSDNDATVGIDTFTDYDLDGTELGGSLSWTPGALNEVVTFRACLAANAAGSGSVQLGSLSIGTNVVTIAPDTALNGLSHFVVFTASSLAEQTTPAALSVADSAVSVSGASLAFVDYDLDGADLGGTVTWTEPAAASLILYHVVYLAEGASGTARSMLGTDSMGVLKGTNSLAVPAGTGFDARTLMVVYTRSSLAEQTTPGAVLAVSDSAVSVASIAFDDLDLDAGDLGGVVNWGLPDDASLVEHYALYLANGSAAAVARSQLGNDMPIGTNSLMIYADTARGIHSHLVLHLRSALEEQTTPCVALAVTDVVGEVIDLTFGDRDFDSGEVGGLVHWTPPTDVAAVTHYSVYRAEDAIGTAKAAVEENIPVGTNIVLLPVSTAMGSYTHMVVYSTSSLGAQTTPAAALISDAPVISAATRWTIANAEPTTPRPNGQATTSATGAQWTVRELQFFSDSDCTQAITSVTQQVASGQTGQYHGPSAAMDNSTDTVWRAQCSPCAAMEAWVGVVAVDIVRCVRWLQPPVLTGTGVSAVALQIGGQELMRAVGLRGERWEGLRYAAASGGWVLASA